VAEKFGLPTDRLAKTIEEYNQAAESKDDKFGKKVFPVRFEFDQKFYAAYVTPSLHYSMGGIKINEKAQALG
jgi:fumarate reductase flavoprotein subunit/urocanate reductase